MDGAQGLMREESEISYISYISYTSYKSYMGAIVTLYSRCS